tara:strand:+ start:117 stop:440 length:324 start_codon:yes stop_codon:yes gene_type:complete
MDNIDKQWDVLINGLEKSFDEKLSLKVILYLIGVQELNLGKKDYTRDEKLNVLHVAVCKILSPYGYYKIEKIDEDGWPHFLEIKALKNLSEKDQDLLLKKAIINYFN